MTRKSPSSDVNREAEIITALRTDDLSRGERAAFVKELRRVGTEASVEVLSESVRLSDINLSGDAVLALGRIGTDAAVDALIECLDMDEGPRLGLAADWLRRLHARRAVPAIIRCLETRGEELKPGRKRFLVLALGEMPHVSAVPVLSAALTDRSYRLRHAAAWALAQIRSPESTAALEHAAKELSWLGARPLRRALGVRKHRADQG